MTNEEAINCIDDILESTIQNDETLDYQLCSFDFDWLEKAKVALEKQIANECEPIEVSREKKQMKPFELKYTPTCPRGYTDCVCDPAYIKFNHPDWYKNLYGDKTPEEAASGCR